MGEGKWTRDCEVCGGTGKLTLMRSWFHSDGYRRERCGICHGTGKSNYRNPPYAKEQAEMRARATGAA